MTLEQNTSETFPFNIESFTEAKNPNKPESNEDFWGVNSATIVISDGATDKSGNVKFNNLTGGQIASQIVTEVCLDENSDKDNLAEEANAAIANLYNLNGIDTSNPLNRIAASLLCARVDGEDLVITQVNNSGFRINGETIYMPETKCDVLHAQARSDYIKLTGDIAGSRDYIMPLLQRQLTMYQNSETHPLGYGVIDGTKTPEKFINIYKFPLNQIHTLELFTDGYTKIPVGTSVDDWEAAFKKVQEQDPNRYLEFPATKVADDRTVLILRRKN
jgi:hypothetical protein